MGALRPSHLQAQCLLRAPGIIDDQQQAAVANAGAQGTPPGLPGACLSHLGGPHAQQRPPARELAKAVGMRSQPGPQDAPGKVGLHLGIQAHGYGQRGFAHPGQAIQGREGQALSGKELRFDLGQQRGPPDQAAGASQQQGNGRIEQQGRCGGDGGRTGCGGGHGWLLGQQIEFRHTLAEELSQLLPIVGVRDGASLFPADHGVGGDPHGLGDPGLGPAAPFALHFQGMCFHLSSPELSSRCYIKSG
ncbi:MAG TPA: hypothetical protein VF043_17175 [Ktedonobacteraceae bacterium]